MRMRKKYVKQIVDVLHEVILSSECGGFERCTCKQCKKTIRKVHHIIVKLYKRGIIDDNNNVVDRPKWCKCCSSKT